MRSRFWRLMQFKVLSPDYRFARPFFRLVDWANCVGCPLLRRLDRLEDRLEVSNRAGLKATRRIGFILRVTIATSIESVFFLLITGGLAVAILGGQLPRWLLYSEALVCSVPFFLLIDATTHRLCRDEIRRELFARGIAICPECEYDLQGIDPARCPECGASLERPDPKITPSS